VIGFLIVIVLILAIFALIGSIWGKDTAQGCFGFTASCGLQLALAALVGLVLGVVILVILNLTGVLR
jgi:hypothetical protein